jgi:hypothetical protein
MARRRKLNSDQWSRSQLFITQGGVQHDRTDHIYAMQRGGALTHEQQSAVRGGCKHYVLKFYTVSAANSVSVFKASWRTKFVTKTAMAHTPMGKWMTQNCELYSSIFTAEYTAYFHSILATNFTQYSLS